MKKQAQEEEDGGSVVDPALKELLGGDGKTAKSGKKQKMIAALKKNEVRQLQQE